MAAFSFQHDAASSDLMQVVTRRPYNQLSRHAFSKLAALTGGERRGAGAGVRPARAPLQGRRLRVGGTLPSPFALVQSVHSFARASLAWARGETRCGAPCRLLLHFPLILKLHAPGRRAFFSAASQFDSLTWPAFPPLCPSLLFLHSLSLSPSPSGRRAASPAAAAARCAPAARGAARRAAGARWPPA